MSDKYEWNLDKAEASMPGMVAFDPDTMKGFIDQGFMQQLGDGLFEFHTTAELGKPVRYRGQLQNGQFVFQAIAENSGLKQAAIRRGNFEVGTQDGRLYGRHHGQGHEAELRQDPNGGLAGNLDVALREEIAARKATDFDVEPSDCLARFTESWAQAIEEMRCMGPAELAKWPARLGSLATSLGDNDIGLKIMRELIEDALRKQEERHVEH